METPPPLPALKGTGPGWLEGSGGGGRSGRVALQQVLTGEPGVNGQEKGQKAAEEENRGRR